MPPSPPRRPSIRAPPTCGIADPLGREVNLREKGFWSNLFASHPPMTARIAALKEMAFQGSRQ